MTTTNPIISSLIAELLKNIKDVFLSITTINYPISQIFFILHSNIVNHWFQMTPQEKNQGVFGPEMEQAISEVHLDFHRAYGKKCSWGVTYCSVSSTVMSISISNDYHFEFLNIERRKWNLYLLKFLNIFSAKYLWILVTCFIHYQTLFTVPWNRKGIYWYY